jgi:exonuclease III
VFADLREATKKHHKNVNISYINVNSLRNKVDVVLTDILYDNIPDIVFIAETKLDDTFNQSCFSVSGYRLFRNDRNSCGG